MEATNIKPMSGLRRFAIALLVLGGAMTTLSSLVNRIGKMDDFWHGFTFGIALVLIICGVVLLFKDQRNLRRQEKEQKKEKDKPTE